MIYLYRSAQVIFQQRRKRFIRWTDCYAGRQIVLFIYGQWEERELKTISAALIGILEALVNVCVVLVQFLILIYTSSYLFKCLLTNWYRIFCRASFACCLRVQIPAFFKSSVGESVVLYLLQINLIAFLCTLSSLCISVLV